MSFGDDLRGAADALVGQSLSAVLHVGLSYPEPPPITWDFGKWHWPEVGVELATSTGDHFVAIWDWRVEDFSLTFKQGRIRDDWLPLQQERGVARAWDVSTHRRWAPLLTGPVEGYRVGLGPSEDSHAAPVAIRIDTTGGSVWIAAAAPRREPDPAEELTAELVWLRHDEVIVIFDDDMARGIGIAPHA